MYTENVRKIDAHHMNAMLRTSFHRRPFICRALLLTLAGLNTPPILRLKPQHIHPHGEIIVRPPGRLGKQPSHWIKPPRVIHELLLLHRAIDFSTRDRFVPLTPQRLQSGVDHLLYENVFPWVHLDLRTGFPQWHDMVRDLRWELNHTDNWDSLQPSRILGPDYAWARGLMKRNFPGYR